MQLMIINGGKFIPWNQSRREVISYILGKDLFPVRPYSRIQNSECTSSDYHTEKSATCENIRTEMEADKHDEENDHDGDVNADCTPHGNQENELDVDVNADCPRHGNELPDGIDQETEGLRKDILRKIKRTFPITTEADDKAFWQFVILQAEKRNISIGTLATVFISYAKSNKRVLSTFNRVQYIKDFFFKIVYRPTK